MAERRNAETLGIFGTMERLFDLFVSSPALPIYFNSVPFGGLHANVKSGWVVGSESRLCRETGCCACGRVPPRFQI